MSSRLRALIGGREGVHRLVPQGGLIEAVAGARRQLVFIDEGWAMKVADTNDGRRQILRFLLPGDCARCDVMCSSTQDGVIVECITACRVTIVDVGAAKQVLARHPDGIDALLDAMGGLVGDAECYIAILGTYSAEERIAWMLLHLFYRATHAGLNTGGRIAFPVNQSQLAAALGLSLVHTNKTLSRLRRSGLVRWSTGNLEMLDAEGLAELCQFR